MKEIGKLIRRTELIVAGFAMSAAVLAAFANVVGRYIFNRPIYQAEEIATSMFVWLVFIGASACYGEKMHIGIDCFVNLFPAKWQQCFKVLTDMIMVVVNAAMAYLSITFTISAVSKLTSALRISYSLIDASAAIGFCLMTGHAISFLVQDIKMLGKEPLAAEGGEE